MKEFKFPGDNEAYSGIHLFNESTLQLPLSNSFIQKTASVIAAGEQADFQFIEVVFVDEPEIIHINREYLERDYVTDIISFRYDEDLANHAIQGTLYCCAPRILLQAKELNESAKKEFRRIIIHGMLHLAGYEDLAPTEKQKMTQKEDYYLEKLSGY